MTKNKAVTQESKLENMTREKILERLRRVYARVKRIKDKTEVLHE